MRAAARSMAPEQAAYFSAKFLAQVGQNLLLAALFIMAATGSQQALGLSSIFVATLVPAAIFGLPGGGLVDRIGARHGYIIGAAGRLAAAAAALLILGAPGHAWLIAGLYSLVSQVFTPAELAMIPAIQRCSAHRAHSILTALQFGGQGLAILVLAPVLYIVGGREVTYIVFGSIGSFVAVTLLGLFLSARLRDSAADMRVPLRRAFAPGETMAYFRRERGAGYAVVLLGFKAMAAKAMFVGLPIYLERNIGFGEAGILFLIIPGAIGMAVGLALAGWMFSRRSARNLMRAAFLGIAGSALALAAVDYGVETVVRFSRLRQIAIVEPTIEPTLWVAVPVAAIIGFSFSLALVSARSILTATAPIGGQARVFATQLWLTDTVLILPLFLAGIGTEFVGPRSMLAVLGLSGIMALVWLEATVPMRRSIPSTETPPLLPGASQPGASATTTATAPEQAG